MKNAFKSIQSVALRASFLKCLMEFALSKLSRLERTRP